MNSYFRGKDRKLIRYSGQTGSIDSLCRPQKEGGRVFRLPDYCRLFMTMADAFGSITIDENIKAPADCEIRLRDERTCFTD